MRTVESVEMWQGRGASCRPGMAESAGESRQGSVAATFAVGVRSAWPLVRSYSRTSAGLTVYLTWENTGGGGTVCANANTLDYGGMPISSGVTPPWRLALRRKIDLLDANGEWLTLEDRAVAVRGHGVGDRHLVQIRVSQHQHDVIFVVAPGRVWAQFGESDGHLKVAVVVVFPLDRVVGGRRRLDVLRGDAAERAVRRWLPIGVLQPVPFERLDVVELEAARAGPS
jgi:hypothetical protein